MSGRRRDERWRCPRCPVDHARKERPEYCCGRCPEFAAGGFDCTCRDNPRCPGPGEAS